MEFVGSGWGWNVVVGVVYGRTTGTSTRTRCIKKIGCGELVDGDIRQVDTKMACSSTDSYTSDTQ